MFKKKICVIITSRAQYGRLKKLIERIISSEKLELILIVAGSALSNKYGNIVEELNKENITIDFKISMVIEGDSPSLMAKSTGLGLIEFASAFDRLKPDLVIVRGDRFEMLAPTIASVYQNIPVAHIEGGDLSGSVDDYVRHAITKLSTIHFTTNNDSYKRVIKLGEDSNCVFNVGAGDIDFIVDNFNDIQKPFQELILMEGKVNKGISGENLNLNDGYLVVLQHPVTTEHEESSKQILETIIAVNEIKLPVIFLWPNLDSGSGGINKEIRKFIINKRPKNFQFYRNLPPKLFLSLINGCSCLIGNSSSGIKEASYLGIPVINIGSRQSGRLKGKNVIDVSYNREEIKESIIKQLKNKHFERSYLYGDGTSSKKIIDILENYDFKKTIKKMSY